MFRRVVRRLTAVLVMALALVAAVALPASAQDQARKVKSKVNPEYPELAKRMKVEGTVKVQVTIAPNGNVTGAKAVGGHPLLVDPAVQAAKKWKYEPGSTETTEVVEFKFDGE